MIVVTKTPSKKHFSVITNATVGKPLWTVSCEVSFRINSFHSVAMAVSKLLELCFFRLCARVFCTSMKFRSKLERHFGVCVSVLNQTRVTKQWQDELKRFHVLNDETKTKTTSLIDHRAFRCKFDISACPTSLKL